MRSDDLMSDVCCSDLVAPLSRQDRTIMAVCDEVSPRNPATKQSEKFVIIASSLGTMFEWYDFYLYGLLATYISSQFVSGVNDTTAFILALAAFAAGFAVRQIGRASCRARVCQYV